MRCSVCAQELTASAYTVSCLTTSGRALCVNVCRLCLADWLGKPAVRNMDRLLDRSGWTQPALPSLG